jgi:hypothetical protein
MNTPTAIFAGLAMIAVSIYAGSAGRSVISTVAVAADSDDEATGKGIWAFRGHGEQLVIWKMNTKNGDLFACSQKAKGCERVGAN